MLFRLIRKFLNRRKSTRRFPLALRVVTTDPGGDSLEVMSEDISERGIRLRFVDKGIGDFLGHRDQIPMEIHLEDEVPPLKLHATLVWAYLPAGGGIVSGWEYLDLKGRSLRRFRNFVDREFELNGEDVDDDKA